MQFNFSRNNKIILGAFILIIAVTACYFVFFQEKQPEKLPEIKSNLPLEEQTEEFVVNIGPQHPSTHGVLRLELELDGELILNVKPHIGYLHRCFEKHAEAMQYNQIVPYTDRLDYISSMGNNFGYVITVEKLLGIQVPERVEYIRVIMAELQRIASHLVALGTNGLDIGAFTPFLYL